ncbi:MAG: translation elongation factor Ts [Myxococcales bacterium]|nr:translation elongation factor Ts [Myxococcales bacterium]MDD9965413.1 translation elongation factor Ts [Myxococcales bacterium]
MPTVTMDMVKELRQRTGAGIMDCKTALNESEGEIEQAIEWIKKKGLAKAAKRAGAIAAEGVVHAYIHAGSRLGVLVEINCQTDFVARSEDFKAFAEAVGLQIASMSAQFVRRSEVSPAEVDQQRAIFKAQLAEEAEQSGKKKPDSVIDKIVDGKLDKWLAEVCLDEQAAVVDGDKTISQMAEELTSKLGEKVAVRRFVRYELGEGIEKKSSDLAADVAAAISGG